MISGEEEAALAFDGAIRHLRVPAPPPVLVVDIGGGSTELILGADEPTAAFSMDIGSVRMHERHLHSDPPTASEVAAATADIEAALDACPVSPADAATVVGIAGTVVHGRGGGARPAVLRQEPDRPVRARPSPPCTTTSDGCWP